MTTETGVSFPFAETDPRAAIIGAGVISILDFSVITFQPLCSIHGISDTIVLPRRIRSD